MRRIGSEVMASCVWLYVLVWVRRSRGVDILEVGWSWYVRVLSGLFSMKELVPFDRLGCRTLWILSVLRFLPIFT